MCSKIIKYRPGQMVQKIKTKKKKKTCSGTNKKTSKSDSGVQRRNE